MTKISPLMASLPYAIDESNWEERVVHELSEIWIMAGVLNHEEGLRISSA